MMYVVPELTKKGKVDEKEKVEIIQDVNNRVGGDINDLVDAYNLENELSLRKKHLVSCLNLANNEVPSKIFSAIRKAILNTNEVENLKARREALDTRVETFYNETESLRAELNKRFTAINKLEQTLEYMKSYEKIDALSRQMKQCSDDEQMVLLYGELKEMCKVYNKGHRAVYIKEYLRYWHNVLKDKITKHYEDVLKQIKWPFVSGSENAAPKEALVKFNNLTRYLLLIQEPEDPAAKPVSEEVIPENNPCLPVKILLKPLKKRFLFHFAGTRQTARIDRPEWFLTQTLTWIKDHQAFVSDHVQPIADKLDLKNVRAVDEFNAGLIALAAERLYTVLALYHTQVAKGEIVDVDAAFAHAVDETLGFNRELTILIGHEENSVLSVLTKAETFVRWLSVEKKYALAKMDETLGNDQWGEAVAAGVGAASGAVLWVPRAADWFVSLLKTIEDRYAALPQPGHRLQFLELQLELIEEWRVRLMQLMNAAAEVLVPGSLLPAVLNAAHYTRSVLLQWAHSLHYLQLHYYRRQFQHFTHQHHEEDSSSSSSSDDDDSEEQEENKLKPEGQMEDAMSLNEVEQRAKKMAQNAISRRNSRIADPSQIDIDIYTALWLTSSPIANLAVTEPLGVDEDIEVAGVFAEAPALLARLRDAGLATLSEHILLEFKAGLRDYKRQKWHGLVVVEARALSVSAALCGPLGALCSRLRAAAAALAPPLAAALRAHLAAALDHHIYQEVVLESWFNTGGTMQFTHDVKRNLVPAFAPPNKVASQVKQLPKLLEACKLLNLDYDDARRLRTMLAKNSPQGIDTLTSQGIRHITPNEALQILNQRTDLSDATSPSSVMELF